MKTNLSPVIAVIKNPQGVVVWQLDATDKYK
jgi:hypothetical protein